MISSEEMRPGKGMKYVGAAHSYELYQEFEDEYSCSGMCQAGLFFMQKSINEGAPTRTCLMKVKHMVEETTLPFANSACIAGVTCLLLFFVHFGLSNRPSEEDLRREKYNVGGRGLDGVTAAGDQRRDVEMSGINAHSQAQLRRVGEDKLEVPDKAEF